MSHSTILVLLLLIGPLLVAGCLNEDVTYNTNYPNFVITVEGGTYSDFYPAERDGPDYFISMGNVTVNVTVTSSDPERIVKYSNGTLLSTGSARTLPVTATIDGVVTKTENITLAYNETKTIIMDLGKIRWGEYTIKIFTPTSNVTKKIQIKPYV